MRDRGARRSWWSVKSRTRSRPGHRSISIRSRRPSGISAGIDADAVGPGREVGQAVELVLDGGGTSGLVVGILRLTGPTAAPEVHAGHPLQQVRQCRRVSPVDRVAGEHDAAEHGLRAFKIDAVRRRHAHARQHLGGEVALELAGVGPDADAVADPRGHGVGESGRVPRRRVRESSRGVGRGERIGRQAVGHLGGQCGER